ncbi:hypothetical protein BX589_112219 [Paraburkholderia fungorum]|uniref:hypothetical protein n=1 Tax=Paraburkholderia fungorum TaxID=134537 RepID=UPI0004238DB2|nr:hypothetical protein [Paraburkholderia fungorum]PRZ53046.1 hypothetical protein BX589_112219 [Paraburkholderia fungorum]PZR44260.1 MAG: hypothetical protein DI523_24670 [Paraburkholderia fungorum]
MEQMKTVILNLTRREVEQLNGEKLGLLLLPKEFKLSNPVDASPDQKGLYQCSATPSVIRQIAGRYDIVDIPG